MATVGKQLGSPDLFITCTMSNAWPEVLSEATIGGVFDDVFVCVARVCVCIARVFVCVPLLRPCVRTADL